MSRKTAIRWAAILWCILIFATIFAGCRESTRVGYNVSKEADSFNVTRRLTVMNARTDTIMLTLTGTFALKQNSEHNELEVICELEDGTYQKHFIYLNDDTLYVVEDLSGSNVSKYHYELNILPQMIPMFVPDYSE